MTEVHRISLNEWLDFFGFKASPFSKWEAEEEARLSPELLSAQWVKPMCFDRVLGQASEPRTVLLFAPRGAGKTACRILVEYYCTAGLGYGERATTGGRVLPILHTHLDKAILDFGMVAQVDEYWHTREILKQGVESLTSYLMNNPGAVQVLHQLDSGPQLDLCWFLNTYPPLSATKISFLQENLGFNVVRNGEGHLGYTKVPVESHLNFNDDDLLTISKRRVTVSMIDQLDLFVDLVCGEAPKKGLGFEAVYILVDGLDECFFSADLTTNRAVTLLLPLLANLRLMNARKFAFKFFLPMEIHEQIIHHPAIRHDRLLYETISWADVDMQQILHRRLATYGSVEKLDMLCAPELRGVEKELIRTSKGNPRNLMRLCDFMLQAHLTQPLQRPSDEIGEAAYFLTPDDWQEAQIRFAETVMTKTESSTTLPGENLHSSLTQLSNFSEEILRHYPGPIALVYLDYLNRQESFAQLSRLFDLFEVTIAFVGIILLSQLRALAPDAMPTKLQSARLRLGRMGLGGWLTVWDKVPGLCNSYRKTFYTVQLQRIFAQERERLDGLRILRNKTLGHGATLTETTASELLVHYEPDMLQVLNSLSLLRDMHPIQVRYVRKTGATFMHRARVLVGDNPNFPWRDIVLTYPVESDKIVLFSDHGLLDLHPFLLFKRCQVCEQEEVFAYQQLEESAAQYIAYNSGHLFASQGYLRLLANLFGA